MALPVLLVRLADPVAQAVLVLLVDLALQAVLVDLALQAVLAVLVVPADLVALAVMAVELEDLKEVAFVHYLPVFEEELSVLP